MLAKSCLQNVSGNWCLSLLDDRELHTVLKPKAQSRVHYFMVKGATKSRNVVYNRLSTSRYHTPKQISDLLSVQNTKVWKMF